MTPFLIPYDKVKTWLHTLITGELWPGPEFDTDNKLDDFIRRTGDTNYHPCCSCKMGSDLMSVTDIEGTAAAACAVIGW